MPIFSEIEFETLSDDQFQEIDYVMMGFAYDIQNQFGRLLNEKVYQHELAHRLRNHYPCSVESPLKLVHKNFVKRLSVDLIVAKGLICELKVAEEISSSHTNQLIQYLLLANASHGKLINFGKPKVEGKVVATHHNAETRRDLQFCYEKWNDSSTIAKHFVETIVELLEDWGGFLSVESYTDAVTSLFGGTDSVVRKVDVCNNGCVIFQQKARLINDDTAFKISMLKDERDNYRKNLEKLLKSTKLKYVYWVNLNQHNVEFETISRS